MMNLLVVSKNRLKKINQINHFLYTDVVFWAEEYREPDWLGNYLQVDGLKPGDKVTVSFPVKETAASYTVNSRTSDEQTYKCVFRGSTLVSILPEDDQATSYPLFMRENMRSNTAPLKKVTRFIPERIITRW